jgi:predicted O-methyltransferase YrrM
MGVMDIFTSKKHHPSTILELGTNCGFSSIYMSKGNLSGMVHTLEVAEAIAGVARENFKALGCENIVQHIGRFQDVLENVLEHLGKVYFAFIDGYHDYQATLDYYGKIKPYLSQKAIVVFDDISWSEEMHRAWEEIISDPKIRKIEDLTKLGVIYF